MVIYILLIVRNDFEGDRIFPLSCTRINIDSHLMRITYVVLWLPNDKTGFTNKLVVICSAFSLIGQCKVHELYLIRLCACVTVVFKFVICIVWCVIDICWLIKVADCQFEYLFCPAHLSFYIEDASVRLCIDAPKI